MTEQKSPSKAASLFPLRRFHVVESRRETEETFTLVLAPHDGEPMFTFKPGQFVMLHVLNDDGTLWAKAAYSIATAPVESVDSMELGIKLSGDFTRRAAQLKPGDLVDVQGPYGMFTLKTDADALVYFAGGIGVTPFRSMIREALLTRLPNRIVLFYSDRTHACMAYEKEFRQLAAAHPSFHPIFLLTREAPQGWKGEARRLDAAMFASYVQHPLEATYGMCGPAPFMDSVRAMLEQSGVDVKARLRMEHF